MKDSFFTYDKIVKRFWQELIDAAKEEFGVWFDLENDDALDEGARRTLTIPQDGREDAESKFRCELRFAGGDWERPVAYFRCQAINGLVGGLRQKEHFVFIPGPDEGNPHLERRDDGKGWRPPQDSSAPGEPDEKLCWEALENHLEDLVRAEIEKTSGFLKRGVFRLPNHESYDDDELQALESWQAKPVDPAVWGVTWFEPAPPGNPELHVSLPVPLVDKDLVDSIRNVLDSITFRVGRHGGDVVIDAMEKRGIRQKAVNVAKIIRQWFQYRDFVEHKSLRAVKSGVAVAANFLEKKAMRIDKKHALHVMDFPSLRQTYVYDCGANAVQTILTYYGDDMKESEIMEAMGTSPEEGTDWRKIVKFFQEKKYKVKARKNLTLDILRRVLELGIPVLMPVQAYRDKPDIPYKNDVDDGHWVVAVGYTENAVIFCDPSSVEDTFLTVKELEERWHDQAPQTGEMLEHFGILVYGKLPIYHESDVIHMD